MSSAKTNKILYWISTGIIALFTIPGIFFVTSEDAIKGTEHLKLPMWFHWELSIGKFIGALILILPFFSKRIKEWAYVAFGIDFLSAFIGMAAIDGFTPMAFFPIVFFLLLVVSYVSFHRLPARTA